MTRTLTTALAAAALGAGLLGLVPGSAEAATTHARATGGAGGPQRYWSAPPASLLGRTPAAPPRLARPEPPATRGTVTGQVVGPKGTPIRHALVSAVRFSDLGLATDLTEERQVLARTGRDGRFRLKQLREPYLVRICSEAVDGRKRAGQRSDQRSRRRSGRRSGECDQQATKRFTPTYLGPDGNLNSWMRHTRMFDPVKKGRSLGRVTVQPSAVVTGRFKGGRERTVYLTRTDGSVAATTTTDRKGDYRFEVAPGPYRVEADHDEGLRTPSTVPGFRSGRFVAREGRTHREDFRTRHAGIIRGLVSAAGVPLPGQFLAILDENGRFAAGVTTNEIGRYVISSLEPGAYTVATSYAASAYVPLGQTVQVSKTGVATADLALDPGRSVSFVPSDTVFPGANGTIDAELRSADGKVVKVYSGNPATLPGSTVTFGGLPAASYTLSVRRGAAPSTPEQVDFPWTQVTVDLANQPSVALNPLALNNPTVDLTGTLPAGGQLRLTALPADAWLQPAYIEGTQTTPMALQWVVHEVGGQYVARGLVPGTYTAAVTTALLPGTETATTTGGNLAPTSSTVIVAGSTPVIPFTAPAGASVRAKLRYARSGRRAIAPFGLRVNDPGEKSWLFPSVSGPHELGKAVVVERLHAGQAGVKLLDLDALFEEHPDVPIAENLVSSARNEPGTSYWFTAGRNGVTLAEGGTTVIGTVKLKLHGVLGVRANPGPRS